MSTRQTLIRLIEGDLWLTEEGETIQPELFLDWKNILNAYGPSLYLKLDGIWYKPDGEPFPGYEAYESGPPRAVTLFLFEIPRPSRTLLPVKIIADWRQLGF